ncbi:MAG: hypothetical protein ACRDL4_03485 [Thermoleophilaceae bacterium]
MRDDLTPARRFAAGAGSTQMGAGVWLFLEPFGFARTLRWSREPRTDVGLYFGRCLGALAIGFGVEGLKAAREPASRTAWFRATEVGAWLLAAVHVRGMLEGKQPLTETIEIPLWTAMAVGARKFAPGR